MPEKILNLTDLGFRLCHKSSSNMLELIKDYDRLLVGSYYCDFSLMKLTDFVAESCADVCRDEHKPLTLVIPIISQPNLSSCKDYILKILSLYEDLFDLICINDPGMLAWIRDMQSKGFVDDKNKIILGRMFFKDMRDPRYPVTVRQDVYTISPTSENLIREFDCYGIEVEGTCHKVNKNYVASKVFAHIDYCCISCARLCFFASIGKSPYDKFRLMDDCNCQCVHTMEKNLIQNKEVFRMGKGIYFKNGMNIKEITGVDGYISFPLDKW